MGRPFGRADRCGGHGPCPAYPGGKGPALYRGPIGGTLGATRPVGHVTKGKRGGDPPGHAGGKEGPQSGRSPWGRPKRIRAGRLLWGPGGSGPTGAQPGRSTQSPVQMWIVSL